jgi:hypothetical protein
MVKSRHVLEALEFWSQMGIWEQRVGNLKPCAMKDDSSRCEIVGEQDVPRRVVANLKLF